MDRTCAACGLTKPATTAYFYARKDSGLLRSDCKDCFKAAKNRRYWADADKARAIARKSSQKPEGPSTKGAATKVRNRAARPELYEAIAMRYEAAHMDERHLARVARHAADRDEDNAAQRAWYRANRTRAIAASKAVIARNPERSRMYAHKTRAMRKAAPGLVTVEEWKAKWARFEGRCVYCMAPAVELEHVIPLSRGGSNWIANLVPACFGCNRAKHGKTLDEWLGEDRAADVRSRLT